MRCIRVLALVVGVVATLTMLAAPSSAGGGMVSPNTVTIEKIVSGAVPAGTTFTVEVSCSVTIGKSVPVVTDIVFDSTGTATTENNPVDAPARSECTATETIDGGASTVEYACAATGTRATCADPETGSATVTFSDTADGEATITVTNTFPPAPPTTTTAPPAVVPLAVVAPPTFTG